MLALFPQASGTAGVRQTLSAMARLTRGAMLDPLIRDQAARVVAQCPRGHAHCYGAALMSWVNQRVRYVPDPDDVEALHDPRLMARAIEAGKLVYGDCDDQSMYLAALLKAVGRKPRFRAVGYDGKPYQHVYVMCDGVKLDATRSPWMTSYGGFTETSELEQAI